MSSKEFEREDMSEDLQKITIEPDTKPQAELPADNYFYTNILLNKIPGKWTSRMVIFSIFFVVGIIQGLQAVVILDLQEKGATYDDQALFSISFYPYIFKIIQAPFIDTFYLFSVGKCKTYIVTSLIFLSIVLYGMAPGIEATILPANIVLLTCTWSFVTVIVVFAQIAGEMWIVKIFDEQDKGKGSMILDLGMGIGSFFSYNMFVPLNSVAWLNENLYAKNHVTTPLITHAEMLLFIASCSLGVGIYVLVFVSERMSIENENPSFFRVLKSLPKFFTTPAIRKLLLMMASVKIIGVLFSESLTLKTLDAGISKTTLVSIDTVTFPIYVIASLYMMRFIKKGSIMKIYFWMLMAGSVLYFLRALVQIDLENNKDIPRTTLLLYGISIIAKFIISDTFLMGFINFITPESVGSTFITFMMCWNNGVAIIPSTIGLKIVSVGVAPFTVLVLLSICLQTLINLGYGRYCYRLDSMEKEEFNPDRVDQKKMEIEIGVKQDLDGSRKKSEDEEDTVGDAISRDKEV